MAEACANEIWVNPITRQWVVLPEGWQISRDSDGELVLENAKGCFCYVGLAQNLFSIDQWIGKLVDSGYRPIGEWDYCTMGALDVARVSMGEPKTGRQMVLIAGFHEGNAMSILSEGWIGNGMSVAPPPALLISFLRSMICADFPSNQINQKAKPCRLDEIKG